MRWIMTGLAAVVLASTMDTVVLGSDEAINRMVGIWVSADGMSGQRVERHFDGTWLTTETWVNRDGEWVSVGRGAMYPKPGTGTWLKVSRTADMGGIVLFESTLSPESDTEVMVTSRVYMEDGTVLDSEEEWRFPNRDRMDYVLYHVSFLGRAQWMTGSWIRVDADAP